MNYIKHLTGFFDKVTNDKTLNPTHVSLYIALYQFWNCNRFRNPISISRDEIMRISKISSKATYHKCLRELHQKGYINYEPSYNPYRGSHVYMFDFANHRSGSISENTGATNFDQVTGGVKDKSKASGETSTEHLPGQAMVPYINNTNRLNNTNTKNGSNEYETIQKNGLIKINPSATATEEKKSSAKKKEIPSTMDAPSMESLSVFFAEHGYPEREAHKFYNYFTSIGWLVGGKIKMVDWQSAAHNWMLNAPAFQLSEKPVATRMFDNSSGKDYAEPL